MGQPRSLFGLFSVFSNKKYNFYNKSMWKNVQVFIQYTVPGFKPYKHESSPITTRPGLPPSYGCSYKHFSVVNSGRNDLKMALIQLKSQNLQL